MDDWFPAASSDDVSTLQELLARDLELLNRVHPQYERTALQLAAAWGARRATAFLLDHGADVLVTDSDGNTALHLAVGANGVAIVRLLLKHCASGISLSLVDKRNRDGYTALLLASTQGYRACVSLLLELGDANPALALGRPPYSTALDLALRGQHQDVIACLREWNLRHRERKQMTMPGA
uniref:Uncharacterized protein n=1 Tax=Globisporangium ultimum (strain ATCC 200006 / CBS 805.95 / DAOM BR144) TaxID=431595 RepID=K3WGZ8_GLOUD